MTDRIAPPTTASSPATGLGLLALVALVVGDMIGAGIYTTSGFSLAALGSRERVLAAWAVAAVIALAGAASYGMLARRLAQSGGEYLYLSRELHPVAGSLAGYVSLLAGFTGAIAFAATALEAYLRPALPALAGVPSGAITAAVIVGAGLSHMCDVRLGAGLNIALTASKVAALVAFCGFAGATLAREGVPPAGAVAPVFDPSVFAQTLMWISLSFSGFNAAVYVAGEARDAERNVPRALLLGTMVTALLYLALNAAFLHSAPVARLSGVPEIAAVSAEALAGAPLAEAVRFAIVLSLLGAVVAMTLLGPRVYSRMAVDGVLPRWLQGDGRRGAPPRGAIAAQVLLALVVTRVSDLGDLLSWLGFTLSLCAALAVSTLFWRHWRTGERPLSFAYPLAPAVYVVATLVSATLGAARQPAQFAAALATMGAGILAWWWRRRPQRR